ncbi:MAG TPA: hypothetical protein PK781_01515 [Terrimesophilobacter sp.]|nr:hypothetical protein [Terrimesophilobacter sp.]
MTRSPLLVWQAAQDPHDAMLFFIRTWAEEVRDQVPIARAARARHHQLMDQAERGEDWSPDDATIAGQFRTVWAAEAKLIWMAAQLDRWLARYARETGQEADSVPSPLRTLRNSLEHLDCADFTAGHAIAGAGAWSIKDLPDGELFIGSTTTEDVFGIASIDDVELAATEVLRQFNAQ